MPSGPNSRAMLWATTRRPALAAAKWAKPGLPRKLADAPVKIKVPRPSGAKPRADLRPTRKPPKQLRRQNSFERLSAEFVESNAPIVADIVNAIRSAGSNSPPGAIARSNKRATSRSQVASVSTGSAWPLTKTAGGGLDFDCSVPGDENVITTGRELAAQGSAKTLVSANTDHHCRWNRHCSAPFLDVPDRRVAPRNQVGQTGSPWMFC